MVEIFTIHTWEKREKCSFRLKKLVKETILEILGTQKENKNNSRQVIKNVMHW